MDDLAVFHVHIPVFPQDFDVLCTLLLAQKIKTHLNSAILTQAHDTGVKMQNDAFQSRLQLTILMASSNS